MRKLLLLIFALSVNGVLMSQEILKNEDVIQMKQLGFNDNIVIAKIQMSKSSFDTSTDDILELKKDSISDDVISAMVLSKPYVEKRVGLYVKEGRRYRKMLPSSFTGSETNTLASALTYGLADADVTAKLMGKTSKYRINNRSPKFHLFIEDESRDINWMFSKSASPYEFLLVKLSVADNHREVNIGKANLYTGQSSGYNNTNVVKFTAKQLGECEYELCFEGPLSPGEYCFVYIGSANNNNRTVFDFSIPNLLNRQPRYKVGDYIWMKDFPAYCKAKVAGYYQIDNTIYYNLEYGGFILDKPEHLCYATKSECVDYSSMKKEQLIEALRYYEVQDSLKAIKIEQLNGYIKDLRTVISSMNGSN